MKIWFVGILVGSVFGLLGVRIHSFRNDRAKRRQQIFQAFPPLTLPPLQAFNAESQFLQPLDPLERLGEVAAVAAQVHPFLTLEIILSRGLQDLGVTTRVVRRCPESVNRK
jgi:hypothetical protein